MFCWKLFIIAVKNWGRLSRLNRGASGPCEPCWRLAPFVTLMWMVSAGSFILGLAFSIIAKLVVNHSPLIERVPPDGKSLSQLVMCNSLSVFMMDGKLKFNSVRQVSLISCSVWTSWPSVCNVQHRPLVRILDLCLPLRLSALNETCSILTTCWSQKTSFFSFLQGETSLRTSRGRVANTQMSNLLFIFCR